MSRPPRNLTLERINRLAQSVADLMEAQNGYWRRDNAAMTAMLERFDRLEAGIVRIDKAITALASEQVLLGNRVEEAFSRALRTNIRLDEITDTKEG